MKYRCSAFVVVPMATLLCLTARTVDSTGAALDDDYQYLQDDVVVVHQQQQQHNGHPRATKMYACLQNCAYCVQFWEHGLYNGRRCAKRCVHRQGRIVVDPDCNDPKMFNYSPRIISDLLMEMREDQADDPSALIGEGEDERDDGGDGSNRSRSVRSDRLDMLERIKKQIDERRNNRRRRQWRSKTGRKVTSLSSPLQSVTYKDAHSSKYLKKKMSQKKISEHRLRS